MFSFKIMRSLRLLMLAGFCICLAACRIPLSEKPLSDASNSRVDERLLGIWDVDLRPLQTKMDNKGGQRSVRYHIQKSDQKDKVQENALQATPIGHAESPEEPLPLYTTHLGMHDYLSLGGVVGGESKFFAICRYELQDENTGKLYLMDGGFVSEQIDDGKLVGQVDRTSSREIQGIVIKAERDVLRGLVERHGEKLFDLKNPLTCRRVELVAQD